MTFGSYYLLLRHSWTSIIAFGLLGLIVGALVASASPVKYASTASVFLSISSASSVQDLAAGSVYSEAVVNSYVQVATSDRVLEPVIEELRLTDTPAQLAGRISASAMTNTVVVSISTVAPTPAAAADLANAVAAQLSRVVTELSPQTGRSTPPVRVSRLTAATPSVRPDSPGLSALLLGGGGFGVLIALIVAIVRDRVEPRVRSAADLEAIVDAPVIGHVRRSAPIAMRAPARRASSSQTVRSVSAACAQLLVLAKERDRPFVVAVTAASAGPAKSLIAAQLSVQAASESEPSLLVLADAEPARRSVSGSTVVSQPGSARPDVLDLRGPRGTRAGTEMLDELEEHLRADLTRYRLIVVDVPELGPSSSAAALAALADSTVIVVDVGRSTASAVVRGVDLLRVLGAQVSGFCLCDADAWRPLRPRTTPKTTPATLVDSGRPELRGSA